MSSCRSPPCQRSPHWTSVHYSHNPATPLHIHTHTLHTHPPIVIIVVIVVAPRACGEGKGRRAVVVSLQQREWPSPTHPSSSAPSGVPPHVHKCSRRALWFAHRQPSARVQRARAWAPPMPHTPPTACTGSTHAHYTPGALGEGHSKRGPRTTRSPTRRRMPCPHQQTRHVCRWGLSRHSTNPPHTTTTTALAHAPPRPPLHAPLPP